MQEHREEVASVRAGRSTLSDDVVDDLVEPLLRLQEAEGGPGRQIVEDREESPHSRGEGLQDRFHRGRRLGGVARHVGVEEGFGDDLQRHLHLFLHVAVLAVGPPLHHPLGGLNHHRAVGVDPLAVKGRLRESPLASPEVPFAGEQPFPQGRLRHPEGEMLAKLAVAGDEHLLDHVRVVNEHDLAMGEAKRHHVAMVPETSFEKPKPVRRELTEVARHPRPFGPGIEASGRVGAIIVMGNFTLGGREETRTRRTLRSSALILVGTPRLWKGVAAGVLLRAGGASKIVPLIVSLGGCTRVV